MAWTLVKAFQILGAAELPRLAEWWSITGALVCVRCVVDHRNSLRAGAGHHQFESGAGNLSQGGGRNSSAGLGKSRMRRTLIVVETALAVILLSGAGLLATSYLNLQQVDPGFEAGDLRRWRSGCPMALPSPENAGGLLRGTAARSRGGARRGIGKLRLTLPVNGYTVWSPGVFRECRRRGHRSKARWTAWSPAPDISKPWEFGSSPGGVSQRGTTMRREGRGGQRDRRRSVVAGQDPSVRGSSIGEPGQSSGDRRRGRGGCS